MHLQIASTVELLQGRATDIMQHEANAQPAPDPLTLFLLFRKDSSVAITKDAISGNNGTNPAPIASRQLIITQGNINNSHMYLTGAMDLFPDEVKGGSNKTHAAAKMVRVQWGDEIVVTDIAREKHMFRRRGWVRRFFDANRIVAGDRVLLERREPYVYRVSKAMERPEMDAGDH
jgi:hypothetical protein